VKKTIQAATVSWRTTIGAIMAGIGIILIGIAVLPAWSWVKPAWVYDCGVYGLILDSVGIVFMGVSARDHHVTSEKAGAK